MGYEIGRRIKCKECLKRIWTGYPYCQECWIKFSKDKWYSRYISNEKLSTENFERRFFKHPSKRKSYIHTSRKIGNVAGSKSIR